jgi:peptide-methionine (S)-S-oxide reductase
VISFAALVEEFWRQHSPTGRRFSRQYDAILFWESDAQRTVALESRDRVQAALGTPVTTRMEPLLDFTVAEDYHQKYYLRCNRKVMHEFEARYADPAAFRESTAAMRVNAWLDGCGDARSIATELPEVGLSEAARDEILRRAATAIGGACGI